MKKVRLISLLLVAIISMPAMAFSTDDERIDSYLELLEKTGMEKEKTKMVERLQWSGLSDPRLYDPIEKFLLENSTKKSIDIEKTTRKLMAHMLLALSYSGNEKYRTTLNQFSKNKGPGNLSKYAKRALGNLGEYGSWNRLIATSKVDVEGKSSEVASYMKMLSVDDVLIQRLAARAIFHEGQKDSDLIALTAEKLKDVYLNNNLSADAQDAAAWFCKAIGQSGISEHADFLRKVADSSPHGKIKKYASKYAIK